MVNQICFIFVLSIFNQIWKKASWIQKDKSLREAADLSQNREEQRPDLLARAPVSLNVVRVGLSLSPQAYAT